MNTANVWFTGNVRRKNKSPGISSRDNSSGLPHIARFSPNNTVASHRMALMNC